MKQQTPVQQRTHAFRGDLPGGPLVITRRSMLALVGAGAAAAMLSPGCSRSNASRVVLYSSADDPLVLEITRAFTAKTGIRVDCVGDTEATKTTGLVARLEAEKSAPRADVWWSSEVLGSVKLDHAGVLEPYHSPEVADATGAVAWPIGMYARNFAWTALAARSRVIAYSTRKLPKPPESLTIRRLLMAPGGLRVGMARPQFGTTRSHIAALVARYGIDKITNLLKVGRDNGLRLYDGNAAVVRAIAQGEIDAGLTDSDDAFAAAREGWPVGYVHEPAEPDADGGTLRGIGPLLLPNSVALVRGGPNPTGGKKLIDFLLSAEGERLIARSESRNAPIRPSLAKEFPDLAPPAPWIVDWEEVERAVPDAMRACETALGGL